tara:strand:+ start:366 stop:557 length:192 start_codon:yes stop_codon:yes gene_type:complete
MEKKEKYKYVHRLDNCVEGFVYMTNLSTNILVKEEEIELYIAKGYILGYCKPYIGMETNYEQQ